MESLSCATSDGDRSRLAELLQQYDPLDEADRRCGNRAEQLVRLNRRSAERNCLPTHLTGSAWIVNREGDKVLLLHHAKLGRWLQPGGHADGDFNLLRVAWREAAEESGLLSIASIDPAVFDIDIHAIPSFRSEPEHEHCDVRFLFVADDAEPLVVNSESRGLQWVELAGLEAVTTERSVTRMRDKWLARRRAVTGP